MKKFTYLFLLTFCVGFTEKANSQITVTQSDMPAAGNVIVADSDLSPTVTPGSAGPSQTWNFTALKNNISLTIGFVTASSTPYASYFTAANLADSIYGYAGYGFFTSTSGAFAIEGVSNVQGFSTNATFNPPFNQMVLQANYLNNFGGYSYGQTQPIALTYLGSDSAKATMYITYADTIDAWGTMTTPAGTYNVLRKKHYEVDIDSIFLHYPSPPAWNFVQAQTTEIRQYIWYTNGIHYPVAIMSMDTTNTKVKKVMWYSGPLAVNELHNSAQTLVYPNPCTTQLTLHCSTQEAAYLSVFDIAGRSIEEVSMKNATSTLNTSFYAKGIYFYKISDQAGKILDRGKFSVQ